MQVDGLLIIKGKTLSMLKDGSTSPSMKVNFTVKFEKPGETTPKILFNDVNGPGETFRIFTDNGGKVRADGVSGHEGVIEAISNNTLWVDSGVDILGSISVDCFTLSIDGRFLVNDDDDTMYSGATDNGIGSFCSGTFEVQDGHMFIRRLKPADQFDGTIKVSGGTMTFTGDVFIAQTPDAKVEVTGGTLLGDKDTPGNWDPTNGPPQAGDTVLIGLNINGDGSVDALDIEPFIELLFD